MKGRFTVQGRGLLLKLKQFRVKFSTPQVAFHLPAGRAGGGDDDGAEAAAVGAQQAEARQAREDGGEAAVVQEHPPSAAPAPTQKVPQPFHLIRVSAASEIVFCEKVCGNKKRKNQRDVFFVWK